MPKFFCITHMSTVYTHKRHEENEENMLVVGKVIAVSSQCKQE